MRQLKPCPFCGMPAVMHNDSGIDTLYYVSCSCCAACSNQGTKEKAIEAWNRRAYEDKLRENLLKIIDAMKFIPLDEDEQGPKGILIRVVAELWPEEDEDDDEEEGDDNESTTD